MYHSCHNCSVSAELSDASILRVVWKFCRCVPSTRDRPNSCFDCSTSCLPHCGLVVSAKDHMPVGYQNFQHSATEQVRCAVDVSDEQCKYRPNRMHGWKEPQSHCSNGGEVLLETKVLVENDGADREIVRNRDAIPRLWKHRLLLQHTPLKAVGWSGGLANHTGRKWTFHFSRQLRKRVSVRKAAKEELVHPGQNKNVELDKMETARIEQWHGALKNIEAVK